MGSLARQGILNGRRAPLNDLVQSQLGQGNAPVLDQILRKRGWDRALEYLQAGTMLPYGEVSRIFSTASNSEILKLIHIRFGELRPARPLPAALLPIGRWIESRGLASSLESSEELVRSASIPDLRIILDSAPLDGILDILPDLLTRLQAAKKDLLIVGPSTEEVKNWAAIESSSRSHVSSIFERLGKAGLVRLKPSSDIELLRLAQSFGLTATLVTCIDSFQNFKVLETEFERINTLAEELSGTLVWCPVISSQLQIKADQMQVDQLLLRALAAGALAMPAVGLRRASSRHLSASALRLAHLFGANDFGVGAIDQFTAESLELRPYEEYCSLLLSSGIETA